MRWLALSSLFLQFIQAQAPTPQPDPFLRENYSKFDHYIPMRDGVKLFTSVFIPKDVPVAVSVSLASSKATTRPTQ